MGSFLSVIAEWAEYLWPFRAVEQWERGVPYVLGSHWRRRRWLLWRLAPDGTLGPGRWPVIPFFTQIQPVSTVPGILVTPLQTVTLRDGSALTFSASVTICVVDAASALNAIEKHEETTLELVSGMLADYLAEAPPERVTPENRDRRLRLIDSIVAGVNRETMLFGVEVRAIRFNNYALGLKTYRLLGGGVPGLM